MIKAIMNWSGGKDSSFALYNILQDKKVLMDHLFAMAFLMCEFSVTTGPRTGYPHQREQSKC